jgi:hypothetical protein
MYTHTLAPKEKRALRDTVQIVIKTLKARPIIDRMKNSNRAPEVCADGKKKKDMNDDGPAAAAPLFTSAFGALAGTGKSVNSAPAATVSPSAASNATR